MAAVTTQTSTVTIQAIRPRSMAHILAAPGDGHPPAAQRLRAAILAICGKMGESGGVRPRRLVRMGPEGSVGAHERPRALLASTIPTTSKEEQVTKSEFVDQVADRAGLSKKDAGDAVDAVLETIEDALKRGSDVTFSGFGKFSVSDRSAREGRNPATGEKIQIAASRVPKFTAGAALKKAVK
ncbi:MAG TPA: HU family DNA-binding protein [Solirubrobacteraceae bacterium]|nr:HU family DNA-binding protein [Solirubrobacteraceae bacterium]